jgi:hypothetical protein
MVLMPVLAVVGEDQVGLELLLERFELVLHRCALVREEAVPVGPDHHPARMHVSEEMRGGESCLLRALGRGAEHYPEDLELALLGEAEECPATPNLDVVGVGAEGEDPESPAARGEHRQGTRHFGFPFRFQTSHGTCPRV